MTDQVSGMAMDNAALIASAPDLAARLETALGLLREWDAAPLGDKDEYDQWIHEWRDRCDNVLDTVDADTAAAEKGAGNT